MCKSYSSLPSSLSLLKNWCRRFVLLQNMLKMNHISKIHQATSKVTFLKKISSIFFKRFGSKGRSSVGRLGNQGVMEDTVHAMLTADWSPAVCQQQPCRTTPNDGASPTLFTLFAHIESEAAFWIYELVSGPDLAAALMLVAHSKGCIGHLESPRDFGQAGHSKQSPDPIHACECSA